MVNIYWWNAKASGGKYMALKAWGDILNLKAKEGLVFESSETLIWLCWGKLSWKMGRMDDAI